MAKRPIPHELKSVWEATVAAEGITTGAGEGTGLSLIDAGLAGAGANSYISMLAVINPGDPTAVDSRDVTAFNNGTGEVTVATVFKGGQVAAGVPYKIVTFRFAPAEVAAIQTVVDAIRLITDALGLQYIEGSVDDDAAAAADFDTNLTEATDTHYDGMLLMFKDGDCAGQAHIINAYLGANGNVAFSAEDRWTEAPGDGDNFIIVPAIGMMAKAIYSSLGTHDTDIKALLTAIAGYIDAEITTLLLDTQIRRTPSGSKTIGAAGTKYLHIDSGTNGAEILAIIIKGVVAHDWTLDVYVPAADAAGATAAEDKRDAITYAAGDTEGGLLKPFAIAYDAYLDFTNDGAEDDIDQVTIVYRSRDVLTLTWEA